VAVASRFDWMQPSTRKKWKNLQNLAMIDTQTTRQSQGIYI
jgi:hypothetical protein